MAKSLQSSHKSSKLRSVQPPVDTYLAIGIGIFVVVGLFMLYSASTVVSYRNFGTTSYYILHQVLYGLLPGLALMYICSRIDYHFWQKAIPYLAALSLLLLSSVKIPGIGFSAGGATRWIHVGLFTFQPSEIAKFCIIVYTAGWIARKQMQLKDFYLGLLPYLVVMGLFAVLILWQPDVGTMLTLVGTCFAMLFLGGVRLQYLSGMVASGIIMLALIIKLEPYRTARLLTFLDPERDIRGAGYQFNQALLAIGAGGWLGYGYGLSRQKYNYLPEAIGDSIFAIMAEELGFLKVGVLIALLMLWGLKGMQISLRAPDSFGRLLGSGIVLSIVIQSFINMGAIIGILPLTGITLPFISYGSSSLIMTLISCGILLNISRHKRTL